MEKSSAMTGQPFVKVDFNIDDVRLLYNSVDFYYANRPSDPEERPAHQQEPERHIEHMRKILHTMLMEHSFYSKSAEDINNL